MQNDSDPVYLDYNATTPLLPDVLEAMLPYLRQHFGNPSSVHVYGRRARDAVEEAREQVARLLGCAPDEICFTSGGTEANNLAIRGAAEAWPGRRRVVTSIIEHSATASPCRWLDRQGYTVVRAPVDENGRLRAGEVAALIDGDTALVTVMHASNETGVIQPIAEIVAAAREAGVTVHSDAAQSVGKVPVSVDELGVDLLSLAGHKLYAPKGVGALFVRRCTELSCLLLGGGQERGRRPGTENVAAIVGLGAACDIARRDLADVSARLRALRDGLFAMLAERVPGLVVNGAGAERVPGTLSVRFPGVQGQALLDATPEVAASTGSACRFALDRPPDGILALGVPAAEAVGTVRLSVGRCTRDADIERAAEALARSWARLRGSPSSESGRLPPVLQGPPI